MAAIDLGMSPRLARAEAIYVRVPFRRPDRYTLERFVTSLDGKGGGPLPALRYAGSRGVDSASVSAGCRSSAIIRALGGPRRIGPTRGSTTQHGSPAPIG